MVQTSEKPTPSYHQFLFGLESLFYNSGIAPSHRRIIGDGSKKGTRLSSLVSVEEIPQIGRVILYMDEHLTEELSLEELAEIVQLSKYQLIRRFREVTGTTPWSYLVGKRIEEAKKLLEGGMPLGQVAAETGFYDQSHLNRVFLDKTGSTPKAYQEKNFANRN